MCGRYAVIGPHYVPEILKVQGELTFESRYNLAPSQMAPVVIKEPSGDNLLTLAKWGLIPSWVKDPGELNHPINAKAETVAIKPMFRHAFRKSRVLVPASGFYEWQPVAGHKQPWFIRMQGGEPFAFGGLLEHWLGPEGDVATFTILTTAANGLMKPIHDRMPAIIPPAGYETWLDPEVTDVNVLLGLTKPYPEKEMEAWPVSAKVSNPRNEGLDLTVPMRQQP